MLLVRHLNKRGGKTAIYRGGGSIGLLGACRTAWLVGRDPVTAGRCVLAQVKNNLASPQPSLAYQVVTDGVDAATLSWQGPCEWSADQVVGGLARGSGRLQARSFLLTFLEGGPRLVRDIWAAGQKQGLLARTLQRARHDLSIHSQRVANQGRHESYWLLPGQALPTGGGPEEYDLEPWLAPLRAKYPDATPLDEG